jgi:MraZ protein
MLIGEFQHSLDEKGRLIIPAKFREDLGEKFIVTRGFDHALFVYSLDQWEVLKQKIEALSTASPDTQRAFERLFFSGAVEAELDKQGRVVIPQHLRDHARIDRDVYVNGVSSKVEIWAKEVWEEYSRKVQESYEEIAKTNIRL